MMTQGLEGKKAKKENVETSSAELKFGLTLLMNIENSFVFNVTRKYQAF